MASPDVELENQLLQVGNLLSPSSSLPDLLSLLDQVDYCLSKVEQSPSESMRKALSTSQKVLISDALFTHSNIDVQVAVASCLSEITRIFAPVAPYDDEKMKEVFHLIVSSFENISDHLSRSFMKRVTILETVAKVRSCVVMLDLECDDLIIGMFQCFLKNIRDYHSENVFSSMERIMTLILEASDDILVELLAPMLAFAKKTNEEVSSIAWKLGEKVLENCPTKLKLYTSLTVNSSDGTRLYSCRTNEEEDSDIVDWTEIDGAVKRAYQGFRKCSLGVVQFDTSKNKFLAVGDDFSINYWDKEPNFDSESGNFILDALGENLDARNYLFSFETIVHDCENNAISTTGGQPQAPISITEAPRTHNTETAIFDSDIRSIEIQKYPSYGCENPASFEEQQQKIYELRRLLEPLPCNFVYSDDFNSQKVPEDYFEREKLELIGNNVVSLSSNHFQKMRLSFQRATPCEHNFKPQQAFLELSLESGIEHVFVVGSSGKEFVPIPDFLGLVKKFLYLSDQHEIQLMVGNSVMVNSFLSDIGYIVLDLLEATERNIRPPHFSILIEFPSWESLYRLLHRSNSQLDEKRRLRMTLDMAKGMNHLYKSHPTIIHPDYVFDRGKQKTPFPLLNLEDKVVFRASDNDTSTLRWKRGIG